MINLIMTIDSWRHHWIPQFIEHYRNLGVERFLISAHVDSDLSEGEKERIYASARLILSQCGVDWCGKLDCKFDAMAIRAHHDMLRETMCRLEDWILWPDADEFQQYWGKLDVLTREWDSSGVTSVGGDFLDRLAENGILSPFDPNIPLWTQFPYGCRLTQILLQGHTRKVVCSRTSVDLTLGNHDPIYEQRVSWETRRAVIHHFKWDDMVQERLQERLSESWKERCDWWVQTQRFYDHIAEHGRINCAEIPIKPAGNPSKYLPRSLPLFMYGAYRKLRWLTKQAAETRSSAKA